MVNILYFTNLIPPIPLSLKDAGMYHSISRDGDGNYVLSYEDLGWRKYFQMFPIFTEVYGEPVYAFSAIFSPSNLNTTIVHEWEWFDETQGRWVSESKVELPLIGGRDGGFRTYSVQLNLQPGTWRVNVETERGQVIGRLRFTIKETSMDVPLLTETK